MCALCTSCILGGYNICLVVVILSVRAVHCRNSVILVLFFFCVFFFSSFFFFQAEDGIRDLVRSRGLGDVYKRQDVYCSYSEGILSSS